MKEVHISAPAPAKPPGQTQIGPPPGDGSDRSGPQSQPTVRRLLWAFGFQALAILLGIALIFM